ncbi:hypothetical protein MJD09_18070, partial [bacterium]|nr:hypothetical protein [bacterium]
MANHRLRLLGGVSRPNAFSALQARLVIKLIKKLVGKDIADIGFGSVPISLAGILSLIKLTSQKLPFDVSGLEWLIAPLAALVIGAVWIVLKWRRRRWQRDLPSYLVLGTAASGARALLKRSGLSEASALPDTATEADLKIEENVVTLKRLGRYVLYESDENDAEKWKVFLTELKENLQGQSIKGVLVVLDTETGLTEDCARTDAQSVQTRLSIMQNILGINPPIYLICVGSEQLPGFVDYFRELNDESRTQPWGVAFTGDQQDYLPATLAKQLEVMRLSLMVRRLNILYSAPRDAKSNIFRFPIEFGKTSKALRSFVPAMIGLPTRENEHRLRGIYFTGFAKSAESDNPSGYFIRNLFAKVIPRDQELAQPTPKFERRKWLKRMAYATAAFGMILVLSFGGAGFSCSSPNSPLNPQDDTNEPNRSEFIKGIDVSHHQGSINWEDVRRAGYR